MRTGYADSCRKESHLQSINQPMQKIHKFHLGTYALLMSISLGRYRSPCQFIKSLQKHCHVIRQCNHLACNTDVVFGKLVANLGCVVIVIQNGLC